MNSLTKAQKIIEVMRQINPTMASQQIALFLSVAQEEGRSQVELLKELKISAQAASRLVFSMQDYVRKGIPGRKDKPGMNLLRTEIDPADLRIKRLYLTGLGQRTAQAIIGVLE